jgi:hypothetical protein
MPSKGIDFSPPKRRVNKLSQNPRTVATRQWEQGLSGLTLALHRADKAATVARSRALKKLVGSSGWSKLSGNVQEERKQLAIEVVNAKRDAKKKKLRSTWIEKHGDQSDGSDEEVEDGQPPSVDGSEAELMMDIIDQSNSDSESSVDEAEDKGSSDSEIAEEVESDQSDDAELNEDQIQSLGDKLAAIRAQQYQEHIALVNRMQAEGEQLHGKETPDDYDFGAD